MKTAPHRSVSVICRLFLFVALPLLASSTPTTLAILKLHPQPGDLDGNYAKFERHAREAAAAGAKIIVTSECYLDGYLGNFSVHPGMTQEKFAAAAQAVDGPHVRRAAGLARELGAWIVFGFSEKRGAKIFNSAALLGPDGRVAGVYSKSHLYFDTEKYEPGAEFPVFPTEFGKIGLLICFDRQVPETARLLALQGAELIIVPAHSRNVDLINEDLMMRVRAFENNAFVVLANPYNALVADPAGEIIAHDARREAEGILYARLDLAQREAARAALVLRRPELYKGLAK